MMRMLDAAERARAAEVPLPPALPVGPVAFLLRYVRRHLRLSLAVLAAVTGGAVCAVAAQYGLKLLVDGMTAPGAAATATGRERVFVSLALFLGLLAVESACWRLGAGWAAAP